MTEDNQQASCDFFAQDGSEENVAVVREKEIGQ
jgi:hypothetical protein